MVEVFAATSSTIDSIAVGLGLVTSLTFLLHFLELTLHYYVPGLKLVYVPHRAAYTLPHYFDWWHAFYPALGSISIFPLLFEAFCCTPLRAV